MKKSILLTIIVMLFLNCKEEHKKQDIHTKPISSEQSKKADFAIVIHGGAGSILKKNMSPEKEAAYHKTLEEAIRTGHTILKNGGSSIDAVTKTINVLEDSPLFNAGKGAVLTNTATNEHDASIMDGKTLNAGASAGTTVVKNPINLAKAIMTNSPHVMLSGKGADAFAKEQGLQIVSPDYFFTERRFRSLQKAKKAEAIKLDHDDKISINFYDEDIKNSKFGTVGCVALDKNGNLAAGTSTGGMTNKRWGRIGDSPIIGAGTYANNNTCAVSCTGWGEFFIRTVVAHNISALMEYKGLSLKDAAQEIIQHKLKDLGGHGGIIAVDKNGNMVTEFNTSGMYRATMNDKGILSIKIFE
ncbi:isoaspartyl peptidase/L-asparaginase [Flavivirga amylovorans]|uniref:Isoaspartyl peptidase/L-asparaginase n=1 Tax=Flavivirga amylovorans TaxID=870486 RepID=A0ABT8WVT6_9FLAO|nr:isoaspartyl peptidase/L-asparaginase [Flavivirga amylovorans]MDO5985799.1 isoaspartyl peptidase/L-asparaginase [Flavivirga amylovorans]